MNAGSRNEHFLSHSKFGWETALSSYRSMTFNGETFVRKSKKQGEEREDRNTCSTHFFEKIISPLLSLLFLRAREGRRKVFLSSVPSVSTQNSGSED